MFYLRLASCRRHWRSSSRSRNKQETFVSVIFLDIPYNLIAHIYSPQGSDLKSTTRLVETIIELEYNAREYAQLNSSINVLSKKHGQLKGAIQAMVELAMSWLDDIKQKDGIEKWLELIETLRTVTEGKVRRTLAASSSSCKRNSYITFNRSALLGDTAGTRNALPCSPP